MRDINRPQILIFPRQSAKMATARIRLTSSHGIQHHEKIFYGHDEGEDWKDLVFVNDRDEDKEHPYTFKLVKRDKVTIFLKVRLFICLIKFKNGTQNHGRFEISFI